MLLASTVSMNPKLLIVSFLAALVAANCSSSAPDDANDCDNEKCDQWNDANDPFKKIGFDIEDRVDELPPTGALSDPPWPGNWWPYGSNGTASDWQANELNPLRKYELAFGATPEGIVAGWDCEAEGAGMKCTASLTDRTPNGDSIGSWRQFVGEQTGNPVYGDHTGAWKECAEEDGKTVCLSRSAVEWEKTYHSHNRPGTQSWFGHCDGWSFAATSEDEPLNPVEVNGVTFEVSDIKAMLVELHSCDTEGVGMACSPGDSSCDADLRAVTLIGENCDGENARWEPGYSEGSGCQDVNPGSLHLALTNLIGKRDQRFYADKSAGEPVWNYPIVGYNVLNNDEISGQAALELVQETGSYVDAKLYATINPKAKNWRRVLTLVSYLSSSDPSTRPTGPMAASFTRNDEYEYVLELDGDNRVVGGEYIGDSVETHPDALKLIHRVEPVPALDMTLPYCRNPLLDYAKVKDLLAKSRAGGGGVSPGPVPPIVEPEPDSDPCLPAGVSGQASYENGECDWVCIDWRREGRSDCPEHQ